MTEYYLQCLIHREKGDLVEFQIEYKGLAVEEEPETPVAYVSNRKDEEELWLC